MILLTKQNHNIVYLAHDIYGSGNWLKKYSGAVSKDGALQNVSRYSMGFVGLHIQTQSLSLFLTSASKPQSCRIASTQNWKYWRWPWWTLCVSRTLLGHTQTRTRSVYQAQSLISCVLFFFSALVTECVSPFHSAWSSIIFNRPASECRSFPKTLYLHSDVIGLCGGVQYWWSALHTKWRRCVVTVVLVSSPDWTSVDSVAVCAYVAISQLHVLTQVLPNCCLQWHTWGIEKDEEFKKEGNSHLQPVRLVS